MGARSLRELAAKSDFLVESYPLGYLDSIGLGYDALAKKNPRLIYASITPFGDTGPGKDYAWADIITWAAGGMMYLMGEEGKPPIQMSLPQAGLHAGGEAAVAMMLAHYPRQIDGLGQRIVVNMQACIVWTLMNEQAMPFLHGNHLSRTGVFVGSADARRKMVYECKDGNISILITGGTTVRQFDESADRVDARERIWLRLDAHQGLDFVDTRRVHENDRGGPLSRSTISKPRSNASCSR